MQPMPVRQSLASLQGGGIASAQFSLKLWFFLNIPKILHGTAGLSDAALSQRFPVFNKGLRWVGL